MVPSRSNRKIANSLVTLSSAAILAVYTAGFMKTRAAAQRLEDASNNRRPMMPAPATAGEVRPPAPIEPAPAPKPVVKNPVKAKSPAVVVPSPQTTSPALTPTPISLATPSPTPTATPTPTPTPDTATSTEPAEAPPALTLKMPKEHYNDGTFLGWGTSRHGDIQASVKIEGGRIVATSIAQCLTRYSCSVVSHLPGQVLARQSPDVDYVSGATQSANAFYWAVVDALSKAK